jgi:hypothetical protein
LVWGDRQIWDSITDGWSKVVLKWLEWNLPYLLMQLTDWQLVEGALLLIGLTKTSLAKSDFNNASVIESPMD